MNLLESVKLLEDMGFALYASRGTADFYQEHSIKVETVDWCYEDGAAHHDTNSAAGGNGIKRVNSSNETTAQLDEQSSLANNQRTVADYLMSKHFDLVINVPMKSHGTLRASSFMTQGYHTRRIAIDYSVPLITNVKNVKLLVQSIKACMGRTPPLKTTIDCIANARTIKLPGLIDVHVHLREPGATHKEDVLSGTRAALAGGFTMVCAMPNTQPAVTSDEALRACELIYEQKAVCDYGLFAGASADNAERVCELAERTCGLKMYLNETFNALRMDRIEQWMRHFEHWPKSKLICVHAEEHALPAVLFLAELYERRVHVCHVATKEDIFLIKAAKRRGVRVTCEVAPHHLFFSEETPLGGGSGTEGKQLSAAEKEVRPRLKTSADAAALWESLEWIDMIASDHAPHTRDEKLAKQVPGYPGLETTLALLITAYKLGKITLEQIVQKCYVNPKRIFELPDQPDTYIEVDLDTEWTIPDAMPFSKCGWTPFAGCKVYGSVKRVILRGEVVYVDGQVVAEPGYGKNITQLAANNAASTVAAAKQQPQSTTTNVPRVTVSGNSDMDNWTRQHAAAATASPGFFSTLHKSSAELSETPSRPTGMPSSFAAKITTTANINKSPSTSSSKYTQAAGIGNQVPYVAETRRIRHPSFTYMNGKHPKSTNETNPNIYS